MKDDRISARNGSSMLMIFVLSSNMVLGFPPELGQDVWAGLLGSMVIVVPMLLIYARLIRLMPGRSIFDMAGYALGPAAARVVGLLFGGYCLLVGCLVISNFTAFIRLTSLIRTPMVAVILLIFLPVLYLARSGLNTLSRYSAVMVVILITTALVVSLLSITEMDMANMMPVLDHSLREIAVGASRMAFLPFGEVVVVLALLGSLERRANSYKCFGIYLAVALTYMLAIFVRTCAILGVDTMEIIFYPNFRSVSLIQISDFLERIESLIAVVYLLGGLTKIAICMTAAAKGMTRAFALGHWQRSVLPVGVLMAGMASVLFASMVEMKEFVGTYYYLAVPFQAGIPLILWLAAELKLRRQGLRAAEAPEPQ